ncbi:hypothetical protein cyc_04270 [Cyclospora cayetanensis]|uniref:Uncharacterized protein n=1 Tax=Cyclospora cayetanensis TaxID=88456 RepID=A0A1D3D0Q6_9EIME|nr:hypothetical protein cyc_04270 [Cyclospora cayetanensis]
MRLQWLHVPSGDALVALLIPAFIFTIYGGFLLAAALEQDYASTLLAPSCPWLALAVALACALSFSILLAGAGARTTSGSLPAADLWLLTGLLLPGLAGGLTVGAPVLGLTPARLYAGPYLSTAVGVYCFAGLPPPLLLPLSLAIIVPCAMQTARWGAGAADQALSALYVAAANFLGWCLYTRIWREAVALLVAELLPYQTTCAPLPELQVFELRAVMSQRARAAKSAGAGAATHPEDTAIVATEAAQFNAPEKVAPDEEAKECSVASKYCQDRLPPRGERQKLQQQQSLPLQQRPPRAIPKASSIEAPVHQHRLQRPASASLSRVCSSSGATAEGRLPETSAAAAVYTGDQQQQVPLECGSSAQGCSSGATPAPTETAAVASLEPVTPASPAAPRLARADSSAAGSRASTPRAAQGPASDGPAGVPAGAGEPHESAARNLPRQSWKHWQQEPQFQHHQPQGHEEQQRSREDQPQQYRQPPHLPMRIESTRPFGIRRRQNTTPCLLLHAKNQAIEAPEAELPDIRRPETAGDHPAPRHAPILRRQSLPRWSLPTLLQQHEQQKQQQLAVLLPAQPDSGGHAVQPAAAAESAAVTAVARPRRGSMHQGGSSSRSSSAAQVIEYAGRELLYKAPTWSPQEKMLAIAALPRRAAPTSRAAAAAEATSAEAKIRRRSSVVALKQATKLLDALRARPLELRKKWARRHLTTHHHSQQEHREQQAQHHQVQSPVGAAKMAWALQRMRAATVRAIGALEAAARLQQWRKLQDHGNFELPQHVLQQILSDVATAALPSAAAHGTARKPRPTDAHQNPSALLGSRAPLHDHQHSHEALGEITASRDCWQESMRCAYTEKAAENPASGNRRQLAMAYILRKELLWREQHGPWPGPLTAASASAVAEAPSEKNLAKLQQPQTSKRAYSRRPMSTRRASQRAHSSASSSGGSSSNTCNSCERVVYEGGRTSRKRAGGETATVITPGAATTAAETPAAVVAACAESGASAYQHRAISHHILNGMDTVSPAASGAAGGFLARAAGRGIPPQMPLQDLTLKFADTTIEERYMTWRIGWLAQKRLGSSSKPVLLLWGLFSLLLPAAALFWAINGASSSGTISQQHPNFLDTFKAYATGRIMLQFCGEVVIFLMLLSSRSGHSYSTWPHRSNPGAGDPWMRGFMSYLFHLRLCLCLADIPVHLLLLPLQQLAVEDLVLYGPLLLQLAAVAQQQQNRHPRQPLVIYVAYSTVYSLVIAGCALLVEMKVMNGPPSFSLLLLLLRSGAALSAMGSVIHLLVLGVEEKCSRSVFSTTVLPYLLRLEAATYCGFCRQVASPEDVDATAATDVGVTATGESSAPEEALKEVLKEAFTRNEAERETGLTTPEPLCDLGSQRQQQPEQLNTLKSMGQRANMEGYRGACKCQKKWHRKLESETEDSDADVTEDGALSTAWSDIEPSRTCRELLRSLPEPQRTQALSDTGSKASISSDSSKFEFNGGPRVEITLDLTPTAEAFRHRAAGVLAESTTALNATCASLPCVSKESLYQGTDGTAATPSACATARAAAVPGATPRAARDRSSSKVARAARSSSTVGFWRWRGSVASGSLALQGHSTSTRRGPLLDALPEESGVGSPVLSSFLDRGTRLSSLSKSPKDWTKVLGESSPALEMPVAPAASAAATTGTVTGASSSLCTPPVSFVEQRPSSRLHSLQRGSSSNNNMPAWLRGDSHTGTPVAKGPPESRPMRSLMLLYRLSSWKHRSSSCSSSRLWGETGITSPNVARPIPSGSHAGGHTASRFFSFRARAAATSPGHSFSIPAPGGATTLSRAEEPNLYAESSRGAAPPAAKHCRGMPWKLAMAVLPPKEQTLLVQQPERRQHGSKQHP